MDIPYTVHARPDTGLYNAKVGIWLFLASEVMLFGGLFSAYVLLRVGADPGTWPHGWQNVTQGTINTLVLALSAITTLMAWVACKVRQFGKFKFFHACTLLLGMTFIGIHTYEYYDHLTHYEIHLTNGQIADGHMLENDPKKDYVMIDGRYVSDESALIDLRAQKNIQETEIKIPRAQIADMQNYGPWHNDYLALYFTMTGLHMLHVLAGCVVIGYLWGPGRKLWYTDPEHYTNRIEVSGLFWHFVDLVWIFLFPVLYLT
ncbi:MAG TPA: cytochrome c oxidase subunit 3 [Candidatus Aquilonibacter sp.]|nr:cytochrome c oxidase subunit 3 [Candidatus Aquilonibacter sp.]